MRRQALQLSESSRQEQRWVSKFIFFKINRIHISAVLNPKSGIICALNVTSLKVGKQNKENNMKTNILKLGAVAAALVLGAYSIANATPVTSMLTISDGTSTVTWDGTTYSPSGTASGTTFTVAGGLGWTGSMGVWTVIVDTGTISGGAANPVLDLSFIEQSRGAGSLTITWAGSGFGPSSGNFATHIGGTLKSGDSVSFETFYDTGTLNVLTGPQTFSTLSYSGDGSASVGALTSPYDLAEVITITHGGADTSSGNANLNALPVPDGGSTLVLLGTALSMFGVYRRSHKKQQA